MKTYAFNALTTPVLAEIVDIQREPSAPAFWDELGRRELGERDRVALGIFTDKLLYYKAHRVNEATIWARAIYPLLMLAERGTIRAWSEVPLGGTFGDVWIHGEADGALAGDLDGESGPPYVVVVGARRGAPDTDSMARLLGAMLCAARMNERGGHGGDEVFGVHTDVDVWTFVRGRVSFREHRPAMGVLTSGGYIEKHEAATILAILESIAARLPA
jgi:hypothetical protein